MTKNDELNDITHELHNVTGGGIGGLLWRGAKAAWHAVRPTKAKVFSGAAGGTYAARESRGD